MKEIIPTREVKIEEDSKSFRAHRDGQTHAISVWTYIIWWLFIMIGPSRIIALHWTIPWTYTSQVICIFYIHVRVMSPSPSPLFYYQTPSSAPHAWERQQTYSSWWECVGWLNGIFVQLFAATGTVTIHVMHRCGDGLTARHLCVRWKISSVCVGRICMPFGEYCMFQFQLMSGERISASGTHIYLVKYCVKCKLNTMVLDFDCACKLKLAFLRIFPLINRICVHNVIQKSDKTARFRVTRANTNVCVRMQV